MRGLARLSVLRERAGYRSLAADEENCLHALAVQRLAALLDLWASDELLTSHSSRSNG